MPLNKKCSLKAFKKNIDIQRKERGEHEKPTDKEVAIAYATLIKACGVPRKARKMTPSEILKSRKRFQGADTNTSSTEDILNTLNGLIESGERNMNDKHNVDQICEMLAAPMMRDDLGHGGYAGQAVAVSPNDSGDSVKGVLSAIDDIGTSLNSLDQLSHHLRNNGLESEANEVKDMANTDRKNKVRLREIFKILNGNE